MAKIRLDKYVADARLLSRTDAAALIRHGSVTVNGCVTRDASCKVDTDHDTVVCDGEVLICRQELYYMLNKPAGFVCDPRDKDGRTVLSLFPKEAVNKGLSCVGRLDKDTEGLLLLTTDGALAHRLLSPKTKAPKTYFVRCDKLFVPEDADVLYKGIVIDGKTTAPALLTLDENDGFAARITLTDGKFHEVKRLCYACGQKEVVFLKRLSFGALTLDENLSVGEYRMLTEAEETSVGAR